MTTKPGEINAMTTQPTANRTESAAANAAELAQVPLPALAGIKRAADAALPYARPELAGNATADFARAWAAEAHWEAMDRAQQRRRG